MRRIVFRVVENPAQIFHDNEHSNKIDWNLMILMCWSISKFYLISIEGFYNKKTTQEATLFVLQNLLRLFGAQTQRLG